MTALFGLALIEQLPFKIGPQVGDLEKDLWTKDIPWTFKQEDVAKYCKKMLAWNYYMPLSDVQKQWKEYSDALRGGETAPFCVQVNQIFDPREVATDRSPGWKERVSALELFGNKTRGSFMGIESIAQRILTRLFRYSDAIMESAKEVMDAIHFERHQHVIALHIRDMLTEYKEGEGGTIKREYIDLMLKCAARIEKEQALPSDGTGWMFLSDRLIDYTQELQDQYGKKLMVVYDKNRKGVEVPGNTARARGTARLHANFMALRDQALLCNSKVRSIGRTDGGYARLAALMCGGTPLFECGLPGGYVQSNLVEWSKPKTKI